MITNDDILNLIKSGKEKGYTIVLRDITYLLLCDVFEDKDIAYKSVFGGDKDFDVKKRETYESKSSTEYLKTAMNAMGFTGEKAVVKSKDRTFEENKAYMLDLQRQTEEALKNGEIDKKDGLKILADISVKLTDKFQVKDKNIEKVVIVNQKFNSICPYCKHEISARPMTKEEAKEKYNLIEK